MSSNTDRPSKAEIPPSTVATDVDAFISGLDAGLFESQLSAALSEVAASVVDLEKKKGGEVIAKFSFEWIPGTQQVRIEHRIKYTRPTRFGKKAEECVGASVMDVGKRGRLTVTQPELDGVPPRQGRLEG